MKRISILFAFAVLVSLAVGQRAFGEGGNRVTNWAPGSGDWTETARWSGGVPDVFSRAAIHGRSEVRLPKLPAPAGVGALKFGTLSDDQVRLFIDGGELAVRRGYIHAGEADGGSAEIVLDGGALHGVSEFYLGGSGEAKVGACRAVLRIRGGSFVSRLLTIGWGQRAEATLAIEGSRPAVVHVLDYVAMGVPVRGREPSVSTLAVTLDERGVTPVTIQSRRTGLRLARHVPENQCRLRIALSAVPPRDDVTLVAAHVRTVGSFDDLPEGAEVRATHAGREYRWTLTYRGGESGCDVALTDARGHADDAPVTRCRELPPVPKPLWETMPAREPDDVPDAPLAFEGAEGFGRHAAGGRGGPMLWVENLDDAGPGSFRAAVTARGPRVVAFRVAGVIALKSSINITEPFLTVDGQTAPEGGVTFTGGGFFVQTHDVILRHFRIRPGDGTRDTDALGFHDAQRCIADHLSVSWGTDEVLSITGLSDAITIQWCLISEALNREQHGFATLAGGERVTWHHNLFAHHLSRVPRFTGITRTDFRNNVLYNWGHTAGYGEFERVNYVGNYLKPGPSTTQRPPLIHAGEETVGDASLHLEGNILEGSEAVTGDNWLGVGFEPRVRSAQPFPAPPVRTDPAGIAFERVLTHAGALPERRDATDARVVREVREGAGKIIDSTGDVEP